MIKDFLLVGLGGALGSMLRFAAGMAIGVRTIPFATFVINIIGSFIIGLVVAFSLKNEAFALNWRVFLATGLCGGFTTFSAFSLENLQLLQEGRLGMFALYAVSSLLFGLAAVWLGYKIILLN